VYIMYFSRRPLTSCRFAPLSHADSASTLRGFVMEVCCNVSQLASGDWTLVTCCASFYMCIAIVCTRKQIHRRGPPGGRLVFSFLAVSVLLHLLSSTVGAAKPRHFRDATASVWAEGNPQSTSGHAMAAGPDGSLWVFGGIISSPQVAGTFVNDLFKLDLDTKEWHLIEPRGSVKPSARSGHVMVSVGSDLYVFGGGGFTNSYSNDLFRFSTTEQKWEQLDATRVSGSPPRELTHHGMVAVGSDLYVFGGRVIDTWRTNNLFRFSTTEQKWEQLNATRVSGSPPSPRSGHGMVAVGSDLYVFGGGDYLTSVDSTDVFRFSTTEQKWAQINATRVSGTPPSGQLSDHGMVAVGSDLYVFGGSTCCSGTNDLFRFSTTEQKWEQLNATRVSGPPPSPRSGHGMVSVRSDLYVFNGGYSNTLFGFFRFSTTEEKWEHLDAQRASGPPPSQRSGHGMVVVGRDLYVFGGLVTSASKTRRKDQGGVCARVPVPVSVPGRACVCACACACVCLCAWGTVTDSPRLRLLE
jgi:N-acetylneuraminic acid mutarotase